jgi:hypothetical protein
MLVRIGWLTWKEVMGEINGAPWYILSRSTHFAYMTSCGEISRMPATMHGSIGRQAGSLKA